jgi:hypothetical protein
LPRSTWTKILRFAEQHHITAIPTLLFFFNGLVHGQIVGTTGKKTIVSPITEKKVYEAQTASNYQKLCRCQQ